MNELLVANVRHHARRYVATGVAVAISMAFVLICLVLSSGLSSSTTASVRSQYQGATTVVGVDQDSATASDPDTAPDLAALVTRIDSLDGVSAVGALTYDYAELHHGSERIQRSVSVINPAPLWTPTILDGSLPTGPDQVVLDRRTADQLGVTPGDTIGIRTAFSESDYAEVTVSGIGRAASSTDMLVTTDEDTASRILEGHTVAALLVTDGQEAPDVASQDALTTTISAALSDTPGLEIRPAHEVVDETLQQMQMGTGTTLAILLTFPLIAIVVAGIVVSSTFRIVLQQRRRELALLRSLGATSGQVRGLIVRETLAVGALASLLGVLLGTVLGVGGLVLLGLTDTVGTALATLQPLQLAGVWVLGTLLTLLFGIRPALGVSRIPPIAALQSVDEGGTSARRSHTTRLVIGVVLTVLAGTGIVLGLRTEDLSQGFLLALLGSMVALVGLLLLTSVLLPRFTLALGAPLRGMVARMARANTVRNPDRTGTTGTAIVIGVTLIVMMVVGAASTRATLVGEVDAQRPFDLTATSTRAAIPQDVVERISAVEGVQAAVGGSSASGTITTDEGEPQEVWITGEPDLSGVTHSPVAQPGDTQVFLPDRLAPEGTPVTLCAVAGQGEAQSGTGSTGSESACRDLDVVNDARAGGGVGSDEAIIPLTVLQELAPDAPVSQVYIRLADGADLDSVQSAILAIDDHLQVSGAAAERAMYTSAIDTVLSVVVGLLGVSVVVALVGVTNTLSLSVAERTRENGLLRALGLTKRQMKRMLTIEAVLIGTSGALVGVGLGILFGWVGVNALPLRLETTLFIVPWWQVLGVVAVAIAASTLASWWPGRRAARTSPVEALAAE